ncbi:MAG: hypothetical protein KA313_04255 [Pseudarcicella sp.]|nr:hypothetical protein [Pseudarcicella sp.]MBP6410290.1 hypothetical protein [Pseudarcicella sp.]
MTTKNLAYFCFLVFSYVAIQLLFLRDRALFDYAFCFIYVASILVLPFETGAVTLLFLGFFVGITIDIFHNTLGIHAAATVLMSYARPSIIKLLTPQRGYDERMNLTISSMGTGWFVSYIAVSVLLHHSALFFLEASNFSLFFSTISKILLSTILSTFVIIILQYFRKE